MRFWSFILLLSLLAPVHAEDVKWVNSSTVKVDINCDGVPDVAKIGYVDEHVRLAVTLGASNKTQVLEFGLGDSMAQDSLCGTDAALAIEDTDYDLTEALGENPEGFQRSKTCKGLNVSAGECDSMHIYWNRVKKNIDWWRL